MSPHIVEPGRRLVERYLLLDHLGQAEHASFWRATDELLDRPVGICLLPAEHPQAAGVLTAARRAAALTDTRFLQVLDASESNGVIYVVTEWVRASTLTELLADGPLHPAQARALGLDIAEALAAAHLAGLSHLCLTPELVLQTPHGQLRISGLAVQSAVRGLEAADGADAARRDATGAAAVTYASLTGRWPGPGPTGLPPAPVAGQDLFSPRQVRAGVPPSLDAVVCRTLAIPHPHPDGPSSPAALARELAAVPVPGRGPGRARTGARTEHSPFPLQAPDPDDEPAPRRRSATGTLAWAAAGLALLVGFVLVGSQLVLTALADDPSPVPTASPTPTAAAAVTGGKLDIEGITGFDPQGDGEENDDQLDLVVDGRPGTVWVSNFYKDPFGPTGLKDGVGMVLDLGADRRVASVKVRTAGGATDFQVLTSKVLGSELSDFTPIRPRPARDVDGPATVVPREELRTRYLLVWLTALPADSDGTFRGRIAEVSVFG